MKYRASLFCWVMWGRTLAVCHLGKSIQPDGHGHAAVIEFPVVDWTRRNAGEAEAEFAYRQPPDKNELLYSNALQKQPDTPAVLVKCHRIADRIANQPVRLQYVNCFVMPSLQNVLSYKPIMLYREPERIISARPLVPRRYSRRSVCLLGRYGARLLGKLSSFNLVLRHRR